MTDKFIERRIITGLIVSTDYVSRIRKIWSSKMLQDRTAQKLANWCIDFYDEFNSAPDEEIKSIFRRKSKKMSEDERMDIEDILSSMSDDYQRADKFNVGYLFKQTIEYFTERELTEHNEAVKTLLEDGKIEEAKKLTDSFISKLTTDSKNSLNLLGDDVDSAIERAFATVSVPLIKYARQLGEFWNDQLVRGGFVALMGPEKRGKTFWLIDIAMKGSGQRANIAFFQAGDMSEGEWLQRVAIYLAKRNTKEKYCEAHYEPVRDCIYNQLNTCTLKARECDFGIFEGEDRKDVESKDYEQLVEAYKENPDYKPCYNCKDYWHKPMGAVWLNYIPKTNPLTVELAKKKVNKFFKEQNRPFRVSTHPNSTLTVSEIERTLDLWEREDGFVPDVIIVDYVDIMAPEIGGDFRNQENDKWKRLRGLSQKRDALIITVTQTDSKSYDANVLSLKNFSEDKRKFGHVTAMFGLNQDPQGREKKIGLMRLNEIVIRGDAFSASNGVTVTMNLNRGRPALASFW